MPRPEAWAASDESARRMWQTYSYSAPATNGQNDPTRYNEFIFGLARRRARSSSTTSA